jgi:twitching motility protein PilT
MYRKSGLVIWKRSTIIIGMASAIEEPVYPVAGTLYSLRDLLAPFADPAHMVDGISRFSDLHIKTGSPVHYRYDGDMVSLRDGPALQSEAARCLISALLMPDQFARLTGSSPTDIDAGFVLPGSGLRFRVNAFLDADGLAAVVRALPCHIPDPAGLGLPDERVWRQICELQQGLVVVAGNTGSGKSTTIASILQEINRHRPVRVVTLEDPIEYTFENDRALFSQRELGRHIPSFAAGLRSALREDPDIILVGEMRDRETAGLALTAAETGHLVLSTLHTKDAKGTITRLVDLFPAEHTREITAQIALGLSYVIAQKLVTRVNGGRRLAVEILRNTPAVANLVRTGTWHQLYTQIETGHKDGMITLERHLAALVRDGDVALAEARLAANDPGIFDRLLSPP